MKSQPARGGEDRLPTPSPDSSKTSYHDIITHLTYEEYRGESACYVHVLRSPGEASAKLPGYEEAHDSNPSVQADVEDGS